MTTYPGQGLGNLKDDTQTLMQPVLSYAVDPKENDVHQCLKAMQTLADEDPLLHVVWDEQLQEIRVQIMGTVQLEIMQQLLLERFGMDVAVFCIVRPLPRQSKASATLSHCGTMPKPISC